MAIESLTNNLNYITFQENPRLYLESLRDFKYNFELTEEQKTIVKGIINDTSIYETYYSPQLLWVVKATGTLINQHPLGDIFTQNMTLNQDDAKEMFKLLMELGADLDIKDYYDTSTRYAINNYNQEEEILGYLTRENNEDFLNYAKQFL